MAKQTATVQLTVLPKLGAVVDALGVLAQAFQDIADALLLARDTLDDVADDAEEDDLDQGHAEDNGDHSFPAGTPHVGPV
jgi:hypothetical protein